MSVLPRIWAVVEAGTGRVLLGRRRGGFLATAEELHLGRPECGTGSVEGDSTQRQGCPRNNGMPDTGNRWGRSRLINGR